MAKKKSKTQKRAARAKASIAAQDALEAAQEYLFEAYESESPRRQVQLAKKALECSPDCADAYVLLAENAELLDEAIALYEQGVAAGERMLGNEFQELEGHFWGFPQTRPYMRARAGLADAQFSAGRHEDAARNYRDILRLNPHDNQGIRYRLAAVLLDMERHDELTELLELYSEDGLAFWSYTRALLAFRQEGESPSACRLLQAAYKSNIHVPGYLTGDKQLPRDFPGFFSPGQENEAVSYAMEFLRTWKQSPGAITWLRKTLQVKLGDAPQQAAPSWNKVKPVLRELPQTDDVWEVELVSLEGSQNMWMLAVATAASAEVRLLNMQEERPPDAEIWQLLLQAMLKPQAGERQRPAQVQVTRKTFHRLWKAKLAQLNIGCEVVDSLARIDQLTEIANSPEVGVNPMQMASANVENASDLASLPQKVGEVWQADTRKLDSWIEVAGQPQRPWISLVANTTDHLLYSFDLAESAPPNGLWKVVQMAISQPAVGPPHLPGVIEVYSEEERRILADKLQELGVKCVVADQLEELEEMVAGLTEHLCGSQGPLPLVDSPGITEEILGAFFHAAAEFYRQTPWRFIPGDSVIQIESDALTSGPWFGVVMGQSGMSLGLALYEDFELLSRMIEDDLPEEESARQTSAISVTYGEPFELAGKDLDAAEKNGWPIAGPEAYPGVLRVNPGPSLRVPLKWELELLRGCLETIPRFINDKCIQQSYTTSSAAKTLTLSLIKKS